MVPVYIWLAVTIVSIVVEALTMGLTSIWFAIGGLVALIASLLGAPLWLQIILFLVISAVTLLLTRPLAVRYLRPGLKKTNVEAIPGKTGKVIETILPVEGKGQVLIDGQVWSAKTDGTDSPIEKESLITVVRVEGVKLVVRPTNKEV